VPVQVLNLHQQMLFDYKEYRGNRDQGKNVLERIMSEGKNRVRLLRCWTLWTRLCC